MLIFNKFLLQPLSDRCCSTTTKSNNMDTKKIEVVVAPGGRHFVGNGFNVHNFIPSKSPLSMDRMDPFIMLDYNPKMELSPSDEARGVGVHPHRGFETVTIVYEGAVEHHDSTGSGGRINRGDVQWMTAGAGVLHKEYLANDFNANGGPFHMVQLWVNLPKAHKMAQPKYQNLQAADFSTVQISDGVQLEIIAGNYGTAQGTAKTFSPVQLMNVKMDQGSSCSLDFPAEFNTGLLVIQGSILVNGTETAGPDHFVRFANEGARFTLEASEDAVLLVMSGQPLHEPIAAYGPFVMNTREEIAQAYKDFHSGAFGTLAD